MSPARDWFVLLKGQVQIALPQPFRSLIKIGKLFEELSLGHLYAVYRVEKFIVSREWTTNTHPRHRLISLPGVMSRESICSTQTVPLAK